ncbi:hypothetical protein IMG5_142880 [Ichthyophthirius multifiliis]|uniref:Uncharacterized protein n=1 Tax=Ichthyophthirius multifiliis TaxID=5932 RepID=G0QXH7_ICHMU|nr:hypothetical protein IMG5_142880 [Ichthyophthirius multifiliis]EGR30095.1 hypothetical protein IMG5_142880 [Ichthyophthirius multifiliis]|eukprot:XP_004031331.1 hypothetical protein IMG5_142880 [Ichthyophthirius multifiliis]
MASTAQSLRYDSFSSLGNFNKNVLSDDYTHSNFETYKFKGNTTQGGKTEYKAKIITSKQNGQVVYELKDEGKLQFVFLDRFIIELAQRRCGDLKFHIDLGSLILKGRNYNFFSNLKTNTTFGKYNWRFGTNYFDKNFESNSRLNVNLGGEDCNLGFTHRNLIRRNNFVFAWVLGADLIDWRKGLTRYDAIAGYENGQIDLYLQHNSQQSHKFQCGKIITTLSYNQNNQTQYSIEVENNKKKNTLTAGFKHDLDKDITVRGKISTDQNLQLALKRNWKNIAVAFSFQFQLGNKLVDFSRFPPLPFGIKFDFKI